MKLFNCVCEGNPALFFENTQCEACLRTVGFVDDAQAVVPFETQEDGSYIIAGEPSNETPLRYKLCENNSQYGVCNAMVAQDSPTGLCRACDLNEVVPDLRVEEHISLWKNLEIAKRRTLYTLTTLNLPIVNKESDAVNGLCFKFMADKHAKGHFRSKLPKTSPVFTGHDRGEITINLAEADEVARSRMKYQLGEQYRTLLGHFRHEIGHYYWDILISESPEGLAEFKALFGDDELDYQEALDRHYEQGPPNNWAEQFVSSYATMHPWEDWAESWAHYLHMLDTLETAQTHQLLSAYSSDAALDIFTRPFDELISIWLSFSVKLNALNRSMGLDDAYPFVLQQPIVDKLAFIDRIVRKPSI